jgi:hypothetical protein
MFRKGWESNEEGCLDKIMAEYQNRQSTVQREAEVAEET